MKEEDSAKCTESSQHTGYVSIGYSGIWTNVERPPKNQWGEVVV